MSIVRSSVNCIDWIARLKCWRLRTPEAPPPGTLDSEIPVWLENHGYLLVTGNRSTMPVRFAAHVEMGHHLPRISWLRRGISLGRIIDEFYLIWAASTAEEYQDALLFIPL